MNGLQNGFHTRRNNCKGLIQTLIGQEYNHNNNGKIKIQTDGSSSVEHPIMGVADRGEPEEEREWG